MSDRQLSNQCVNESRVNVCALACVTAIISQNFIVFLFNTKKKKVFVKFTSETNELLRLISLSKTGVHYLR